MDYNINGVIISEEKLNEYYDRLINEIFKILGIYESCEKTEDFTKYISYLDKVIPQLKGTYDILGNVVFLSLTTTLIGMQDYELLTHKKVRSLVFHCIDMITKTKVVS